VTVSVDVEEGGESSDLRSPRGQGRVVLYESMKESAEAEIKGKQ